MTRSQEKIDEIFTKISKVLESQGQSEILQDYFFNVAKSLFYANLIKNFFNNLLPDKIFSLGLPVEQIEAVKTRYAEVEKDADRVLSNSFQKSSVDQKYYDVFKSNRRDFTCNLGIPNTLIVFPAPVLVF